jgi:hypothetical protein
MSRLTAFASLWVFTACAAGGNPEARTDAGVDGGRRVRDAESGNDAGDGASGNDAATLDASTPDGGTVELTWEDVRAVYERLLENTCKCASKTTPEVCVASRRMANVSCHEPGFNASYADDPDFWACDLEHTASIADCAEATTCDQLAGCFEPSPCVWSSADAERAYSAAYYACVGT